MRARRASPVRPPRLALGERRLFFLLRQAFVERAVPAFLRDVEEDAFGILELALVIHALGIAEIEAISAAGGRDLRFGLFEILDPEAEMMDAVPAIGGIGAGPVGVGI